MDIVVAGCGKIGETIISSLTNEGLNITVIDTDSNVINEITNIYDVYKQNRLFLLILRKFYGINIDTRDVVLLT